MKRYTPSHEWIEINNGVGTVGITSHAQQELGDIVYVELPAIGKHVEVGQEAAVLESTKAAVDIYAPVSGKIVAVNSDLAKAVEPINQSPEVRGWLFKIELTSPEEMEELLDESEYLELIQR